MTLVSNGLKKKAIIKSLLVTGSGMYIGTLENGPMVSTDKGEIWTRVKAVKPANAEKVRKSTVSWKIAAWNIVAE